MIKNNLNLFEMTDQELWGFIKEDDEAAFKVLFERYSVKIYQAAYSYLKDSEESENIVHEIFLGVWQNRRKLEIISFKAYLTTAARYRVYKVLASRKKEIIDYSDSSEEYVRYNAENMGYQNLICKDLESEIEFNLKKLPQRCREIFLLSRKANISNEEIANSLGISKRTVENQITYALKHFRIKLSK